MLKGAASGGEDGFTFGAGSLAQLAAVDAAASAADAATTALAPAAGVSVTEGMEMATVGAAAAAEEVGIESAIAAGAAAGGLGMSELGPLALGGAVLGAGVGALSYALGGQQTVTTTSDDVPDLPSEYTERYFAAENEYIQHETNQQLAQELFQTLPASQREGQMRLNVDRDEQGLSLIHI